MGPESEGPIWRLLGSWAGWLAAALRCEEKCQSERGQIFLLLLLNLFSRARKEPRFHMLKTQSQVALQVQHRQKKNRLLPLMLKRLVLLPKDTVSFKSKHE